MGAEPSLSTVDKLLYLGRVSWPHATVPVALRRLSVAAEHMRQRAFERGRELAREGEPMASCYLLVRGRLRVSRRGVVARRGGARLAGRARGAAVAGSDGSGRRRGHGRPGAPARRRHARSESSAISFRWCTRRSRRHAAAAGARAAAGGPERRSTLLLGPAARWPSHEPGRGPAAPANARIAVRKVEHRRARGARRQGSRRSRSGRGRSSGDTAKPCERHRLDRGRQRGLYRLARRHELVVPARPWAARSACSRRWRASRAGTTPSPRRQAS
jgi:hypothetical protein